MSTGRRHLIDVSTITPSASEEEQWAATAGSVATAEPSDDGADGRAFSGRGRVRVELGPDEYEEYRRLLNAESSVGPAPDTIDQEAPDGGQGLEEFVGQLDRRAEPRASTAEDQAAHPVDPFFDALRPSPVRRGHASGGRGSEGSAALDGVVVPSAPQSRRAQFRVGLLGTVVLLALSLATYLVVLPRSPTRAHVIGGHAAASGSSVGDLKGFASALSGVDQAARNVVRVAGDRERAALASAKAQRAAHRRRMERQKRRARQARAVAADAPQQQVSSSSAAATATQPAVVTAPSSTASGPTEPTGSTNTAPTSSGGTTVSTGGSTPTHSRAFGDGGVLGAGHAG